MKRAYFRGLIYTIVFAANFSFYNCEAAINCVLGLARPELPNKQLVIGYFNQAYYDVLVPYIPQNPDTEGYDWYFEIEGELPEEITVYQDSRGIVFEGIPKQTGVYGFKISLDINPVNGAVLCDSAKTSKEYVLQINP